MEKITIKNSRNQNLVGEFYPSSSNSVVIMVHGFTGDKSEFGMFDKIAESLNKNNFNVIKFDFAGCGESDDESLTADKQIEDLQDIIKYVQRKEIKNIALFGQSLGGLISFKCYTPIIKTMVFTAPVTDKVTYPWDKRYSTEQLKELKEKGFITKTRDEGVRKKFIIDKQMLVDRETVNQKELLQNITCPVLIIHGNDDKHVSQTDSERAIKLLSKESKLEILEGADHGFKNQYLDKVIELTNDWFNKYLKS
jgi:pimeloyl-ACP methyl ester carboxylesterase